MKHINPFETIEQDIKDICVELEDSGFRVTTRKSGNMLFVYFIKNGDVVLYDSIDDGVVISGFDYYKLDEIEEKCDMISDLYNDNYSLYFTYQYIESDFDGDLSIESEQTGYIENDSKLAKHYRLIYTCIQLQKMSSVRKFLIKRFTH